MFCYAWELLRVFPRVLMRCVDVVWWRGGSSWKLIVELSGSWWCSTTVQYTKMKPQSNQNTQVMLNIFYKPIVCSEKILCSQSLKKRLQRTRQSVLATPTFAT